MNELYREKIDSGVCSGKVGEGKEKKKDGLETILAERRQGETSRTLAIAMIPAPRMGKLSLRQVRDQ